MMTTRPLPRSFVITWTMVAVTSLACVTGSAPTPEPGEPVATGPLLYVANQDAATVSIIDTERNIVVETIDLQALGFTANAKPHHTAVEPDGSHWYVSLIADGKILKFNRDNELVGQADFETPGMLALHPTDDLLFVGRSMAAVNPPQRIGMIRRSDMRIEEIDVFFARPHALAVDTRGDYVYSGSLSVNQLVSVHIDSEERAFTSLDGPTHVLVQFAVSPDGMRLVATGQLTGTLFVFDSSNPANLELLDTVDVNAWPWHPTFSPDGRYVYFGNQEANTVTFVDALTWEVAAVVTGEGLAEPHGIAVSPDGRHVYVSNRNLKGSYAPPPGGSHEQQPGTVVVINAETRQIEQVIEVGPYAAGMSIGPAN